MMQIDCTPGSLLNDETLRAQPPHESYIRQCWSTERHFDTRHAGRHRNFQKTSHRNGSGQDIESWRRSASRLIAL